MSEFIKKNNDWFRNNSDGTQTKVLFKDGYFYWKQYDGKQVRSKKKYKLVKKEKFNSRDTILNLNHRLKVKEADKRTAETSAFEKPLNFLSPSLYIGAAIDYYQGESPFWKGVYNGNSGWVPDNFARQYPRATTLINSGVDIALGHGIGKIYNWGTTPRLIGEGASKKVYSAPFSNKVYSVGGNPEYVQTLSNVPGAIPYKLVGKSLEGEPVYVSPKVKMVSKPSKGLIRNFIKNQFFPTEVIGDTETVFINPGTKQVLLDMEYGKDWLGRTYAVDPEILSTKEYFSILKNGGKLIPKFLEGNVFLRIFNNVSSLITEPIINVYNKLSTPNWNTLSSVINRYNPENDHYLNEILSESRNHGFNNYLIAAIMANAIHENLGSLLSTKNGRVGLWQGDARLASYLGDTVASNMKAFKTDYDYGTWYNTYDKNGWNPKFHKIFKNAVTVDDATWGMAGGYERFGGSDKLDNFEVQSRIKTAKAIYNLINK